MVRFRSPLIFRFNYCSRFTSFRYLFFIYKLFYNPYNLWALFTTLVLRKYLWVRFVKRNYVYYLRCLNPLKQLFCLRKRFFFLLQSLIFPMFHILFCTVSTTFSFLLNRLFWLLFYLCKVKSHFFFIRNLTFPALIFINNKTNDLLRNSTLASWSSSFFFNYFFSKLYKAFSFRFFLLWYDTEVSLCSFNYCLFSIPHNRNLLNTTKDVCCSQFLTIFLYLFSYYCLLFLLELYIVTSRLVNWLCSEMSKCVFVFVARPYKLLNGGCYPKLQWFFFWKKPTSPSFFYFKQFLIYKKAPAALLHKKNRILSRKRAIFKLMSQYPFRSINILDLPFCLTNFFLVQSQIVFFFIFRSSQNLLFVWRQISVVTPPLFSYFFSSNFFIKTTPNCFSFFKLYQLRANTRFVFLHNCIEASARYSRSFRSFSVLKFYNTYNGYCSVRLPSKRIIQLFMYSSCIVLPESLTYFFRYKSWLYKNAGSSINLGFRPTVRGIAKNPVDHPHGGRTNSIKSPRTPWGFTTRLGK